MSVVHVYKAYPPVRGGIEGHVALLGQQLVGRGVRVDVLCAAVGGGRDEVRDGVHVRRCFSPLTLASTPLPPALPWVLRHSDADIVHLHFPWPPAEVAWLLGGRHRPLVVSVHCEAVRQARLTRLLSPLTQRVLQAAGRIVVNGAYMRNVEALGPHRDRLRIIPYGVDLDHFRPLEGVRDPFPNMPRPRVLFVGRLRHYKGLPVLAEALSRLPDATLIVAGDGPERAALETALRNHNCRDRAHLVGELDDPTLLALLQTVDVAVLPSTSRAEAFGIATAEAQSCGVPAVTTEVGTATAATVADGVSGRVVAPNDPVALAAALMWCLDPARAPALRLAARAHAVGRLSAARMTDAVQTLYAELSPAAERIGARP